MYIAVLAGIDPTLHEAAVVDGASLWKRIIHIDIPVSYTHLDVYKRQVEICR